MSVLPSLSYHCAVITSLSLWKPPPPKPYTTQVFVYSKAKLVELQNSLSSVDWSTVLSAESLDGITSSWTEVFLSECRKFIPVDTLHINPRSKPWYSRYLKYVASCRDRLFKRSRKRSASPLVTEAYRKVCNLFVAGLRAAKKRYFNSLGRTLLSPALNPQRWWKLAKKACGWSLPRRIPALTVDNNLVTSNCEQAVVFNNRFKQQCSTFPPATLPKLAAPSFSGLFKFRLVTPLEVFNSLVCLPGGKSCGQDEITNELLKLAAPSIADSLSSLFNSSLLAGEFPDAWKTAFIMPILKEGKNPTEATSYRPVALLSCLSKVLERLVHEQLLTFCLENQVIPQEQFGFLKGRSAEWQLLSVLEDWYATL